MEAFHSFWSEPNRCRNRGKIRFPDYEQLTAILSALQWQKHNGRIRMITDSAGEQFLNESGLICFWDETVVALDFLKEKVDPFAFWAAGKLYALKMTPAPCVMLDTDLIVWKNIENMLQSDVVAAHSEVLNPQIYPDPSVFQLKNGYHFPRIWDFKLYAANTAFLYIKNAAFRNCYVDASMEFMQNVITDRVNPVHTMCFAEQRILPMCAKAEGEKLQFLMQGNDVYRQDYVTHTWGFKRILMENQKAREEFCMRCVRRIALAHPDKLKLLENCPDIRKYYLTFMNYSSVIPEASE